MKKKRRPRTKNKPVGGDKDAEGGFEELVGEVKSGTSPKNASPKGKLGGFFKR